MNFKGKEKFARFIEKVHLRVFGHEIGSVMRQFVEDLSFVFIFMFCASSLIFVFNVFGARILGVVEFGKFQIVLVGAQIAMIFMLFGINTSTAKYISESKIDNEKRQITSASFILFLLFLTTVTSILLSTRSVLSNVFSVDVFVIIQMIFFAVTLSFLYFVRSILQGWSDVRIISIFELVAIIVAMITFLFLIFFNKESIDYLSYYISLNVGYIGFIVGSLMYSKKYIIFAQIPKYIYKKVLSYGVFAIIGSVSGILLGAIDKLILNNYYGADIVGLYSAYVLASTVIFTQLVGIFNTVFFPYASASDEKIAIIQKIKKISGLIFIGVFIVAIASIVVVIYLLGDSFKFCLSYAILFAINASIMVTYQIKMWFLNADGIDGVKMTVFGTIITGFLNLFLNMVLAPSFGIVGVIIATIISNAFLYFYFTCTINRLFL